MSGEADNLVLRLLGEMRADMKVGFDAARAGTSDLRRDVSAGFASMTGALTTIVRRLDEGRRGS